jgi:ATP/maltotriose-dependent transcriptional regulator MalT
MPQAVPTLSWSPAEETYVCVSPQRAEAHALAPESPAWFAWLAERSSFAFHGQQGSFTARLEAMQRGERYWYAYLRTGQKLRKKYLGKTEVLTAAHLEQVARVLHPERAGAVLPDTALPARKAHHEPASTPQGVTPAPAPHTPDGPASVVPQHTEAAPALSTEPHFATKFYVPRPPTRLVHRARLLARLSQGLSQPLILVCAPAGFGKTTLVAEWLSDGGLPAAWLSLDEEDNDPQRFLSALLAAFQTCDPSLGARLQAHLSQPHGLQGLSLSAVFTQLVGELARRTSGDFLLVLDDYHTITLEPIQHAVASPVEHCPPHLHLLIASRSDPPLPLPRLRARGQLCELRAADLQFDHSEADSFLHTALSRDLEPSTLATIWSRTEGWIAGLQLTALLLQGQRSEAEVQHVLADALGTHRYLVEYLGEEVFSHQPEAVQAFLLHTCILPRFSAPLCAAVSGRSAEESTARLSFLERANLFLVSLDAACTWYRYHPLWAAVLRTLLVQRLGAEGVADLYGRASRWYEQHDLPAEAIEAAIQAGEFEHAIQLVEQLSPLLLARSQYYTLRRWIEQLPRELWATRPLVCLAYAYALFLSGASDAYAEPLEAAEQLFRGAQSRIGLGMVEALRALAALLWVQEREAQRASQQALALLPDSELALRSVSLSVLGGSHYLLGELELARQELQEACRLHGGPGNFLPGLLLNMILQADVLAAQGRLHEAADGYQQVILAAAERREIAIEASIRQAGISYEWNALERVEAQLAGILDESETLVATTFFARGALSLVYLLQARIRQARGEDEGASALLRQAVTLSRQRQHRRFLAQARAAQVRFWLAQGQTEAVTRWREEEGGTIDTTPSYGNEPGALTLARVLIAQGEPAEALRRLAGFRVLAREQRRLGSELEILVLCALAEDAQGQSRQAVQHLSQALTLAEPEGYVRLFVDEGVPMLNLLRQVAFRSRGKHGDSYLRRLLDVLQAEHPEQAGPLPGLLVPLSGRERTILRGLAAGRSTAQMADELVVSANTVKAQLGSLYRKLNVHSREHALREAVRLHLL